MIPEIEQALLARGMIKHTCVKCHGRGWNGRFPPSFCEGCCGDGWTMHLSPKVNPPPPPEESRKLSSLEKAL